MFQQELNLNISPWGGACYREGLSLRFWGAYFQESLFFGGGKLISEFHSRLLSDCWPFSVVLPCLLPQLASRVWSGIPLLSVNVCLGASTYQEEGSMRGKRLALNDKWRLQTGLTCNANQKSLKNDSITNPTERDTQLKQSWLTERFHILEATNLLKH